MRDATGKQAAAARLGSLTQASSSPGPRVLLWRVRCDDGARRGGWWWGKAAGQAQAEPPELCHKGLSVARCVTRSGAWRVREMDPLLKQDECSQLWGSLNIWSSSEGTEEISSAQRLYAEIKCPCCCGSTVTVPPRDPPAPTARGQTLTAARCTLPSGFPSGQCWGCGSHRQNPEPPCWFVSPAQRRTPGTALVTGMLLPARRAQRRLPHPARVRADAGRGCGTKAPWHGPGGRVVGAQWGTAAGAEPATQRPEGPDPAAEGLHRRRAGLLRRTGPASPASARATGSAAAARRALDEHWCWCCAGSAGSRGWAPAGQRPAELICHRDARNSAVSTSPGHGPPAAPRRGSPGFGNI